MSFGFHGQPSKQHNACSSWLSLSTPRAATLCLHIHHWLTLCVTAARTRICEVQWVVEACLLGAHVGQEHFGSTQSEARMASVCACSAKLTMAAGSDGHVPANTKAAQRSMHNKGCGDQESEQRSRRSQNSVQLMHYYCINRASPMAGHGRVTQPIVDVACNLRVRMQRQHRQQPSTDLRI